MFCCKKITNCDWLFKGRNSYKLSIFSKLPAKSLPIRFGFLPAIFVNPVQSFFALPLQNWERFIYVAFICWNANSRIKSFRTRKFLSAGNFFEKICSWSEFQYTILLELSSRLNLFNTISQKIHTRVTRNLHALRLSCSSICHDYLFCLVVSPVSCEIFHKIVVLSEGLDMCTFLPKNILMFQTGANTTVLRLPISHKTPYQLVKTTKVLVSETTELSKKAFCLIFGLTISKASSFVRYWRTTTTSLSLSPRT